MHRFRPSARASLAGWVGIIQFGLCTCCVASGPKEPAEKLPVPEGRSLEAPERELRETFRAVYEERLPDAMVSLSEKLIKAGRRTDGDPLKRFVFFREARDLAAGAGDADTAMLAVDQMARFFAIDALEMKAAALETVAASSREPVDFRTLAEHYLSLTRLAISSDDFEVAERMAKKASLHARRSQSKEMDEQARFAITELVILKRLYGDMRKAAKKLLKDTADARSNLAVARYSCLVQCDLEEAIPHLGKTDDPRLGDIARRDLAAPSDAHARVLLADLWWDLPREDSSLAASKELVKLPYRWLFLAQECRKRAHHWYRLAQPELDAVKEVVVSQRLETLAGIDTALVGARKSPAFRVVPPDKGFLAGVRVSTSAEDALVRSVQPIFLTPEGTLRGKAIGREKRHLATVLARPGYAVGGLVAKGRNEVDGLNGFRLVFMRIRRGGLDPNDSYESPWFGGRGGAQEVELGMQGHVVLGIHGTSSRYIDGIGLVLAP